VRITVEAGFAEALRTLPPDRAKKAKDALLKFQSGPRRRSLDFRNLKSHPGYFIIDAGRGDRVILRKEAEDHYTAVDVGPHDNLYRRWTR
jgi:hypothetical protein